MMLAGPISSAYRPALALAMLALILLCGAQAVQGPGKNKVDDTLAKWQPEHVTIDRRKITLSPGDFVALPGKVRVP